MNKNNLTVATIVTLVRIACIPGIVWYIVANNWHGATLVFTVAALTDIADGWIARYLKQETELGAYLDPLADKLLFISCYFALITAQSRFIYLPTWFCWFMLIKEALLAGGAFYLGLLRKSHVIRPSVWGKLTTFVQTCFLWFVCGLALTEQVNSFLLYVFLVLIILLTIISVFDYIIRASKLGGKHANLS